MIDYSAGGFAYNRYTNLDTIEDRIIYYLLSPNNKDEKALEQTHNIWKILMYDDINALNFPLPKYSDVIKLIENDNNNQSTKRIFRTPHLDDAWNEQCSMIKIYIDSILPENHLKATVNIGIDIVVHNKLINLNTSEDEKNTVIDFVDGEPVEVGAKSRVAALVKAVLHILNGADIAGVGRMSFDMERNRFNQAQYGIWNNRNFEGIKIIMGVTMSGVS